MPYLVSVVIPVRDRLDLLQRALQSVSAQTAGRIEVIIVDDGSKVPLNPATLTSPHPLRVIRNDLNLGAQYSRLLGTEAASGVFVALLDSDDWWHPDKLRRQLAVLALSPEAIVATRLVTVRGTLHREAPWRPLLQGERIEDFLYIHRGMLQSSTIVADRCVMIGLLQATWGGRVHNDTMLFLEAQRRGLHILQMPDALTFFDDNPRPDRVSYDHARIEASEAWFRAVSSDWSPQAQRGFMLTDMVMRYVNTNQRWKALKTLWFSYHPKATQSVYLKKLAKIVFSTVATRFV